MREIPAVVGVSDNKARPIFDALRENVDELNGFRGDPRARAIRLSELLDLGIVSLDRGTLVKPLNPQQEQLEKSFFEWLEDQQPFEQGPAVLQQRNETSVGPHTVDTDDDVLLGVAGVFWELPAVADANSKVHYFTSVSGVGNMRITAAGTDRIYRGGSAVLFTDISTPGGSLQLVPTTLLSPSGWVVVNE